MDSSHQHKILVVDNNGSVSNIADQISTDTQIQFTYAKTGESALEIIKENPAALFPVIIAEQNLSGIKGTAFFENILLKYPHTSFFLMADHADIDTITDAVNKGLIQRYLAKPLNPKALSKAVNSSIKTFESLQDNEKLLQLAKQQNTQLYELNCKLMEATTAHNKTIADLDKEIELLEKSIRQISDRPHVEPNLLSPQITEQIMDGDLIDCDNLQALFSQTIQALHNQFTELAYRNGFEIPQITSDGK